MKRMRILHPTDLSPNAAIAFHTAVQFARRFDAGLDVLHIAPTFGDDPLRNAFNVSIDEKRFYASLIQEVDQKMIAMQENEDVDEIEIRRIHARGNSPASTILDYTTQQQIDLIVMGTHGHRGLKKIILGNTALEVVRHASCDVITVNDKTPINNLIDPKKSMLVPVDMTSNSKNLLSRAFSLAKKLNYDINLLHVVETAFVPALGLDAGDLYRLLPSRKKQAREKVEQLIQELEDHHGTDTVSLQAIIGEGRPSRVIIDTARDTQSHLIVMGHGTMNWLERIPMGSVSEHILSSAPCPVYLQPAPPEHDKNAEIAEKSHNNLVVF